MTPVREVRTVVEALEALADGHVVTLTEFSDQASPATEADVTAARLRELARQERGPFV